MCYKSIKFLFLNVVDPMSYQTENRALTQYDNLYTEYNTYICINPEYSFVKYQYYCFIFFNINVFLSSRYDNWISDRLNVFARHVVCCVNIKSVVFTKYTRCQDI